MSEVKLVARTLALFELFAQEARPLSLTELSRGLDAPMSSTLALVRTLVGKGYLYETRRRAGYYPTRRMLGIGRRIEQGDSVNERLLPYLERLRDLSGETSVLGKREGACVLYLDVLQCGQPIQYTAEAGATRLLHCNSLGKALLMAMPDDALQDIFRDMDWTRFNDDTRSDPQALLRDLQQGRARGWASNVGESQGDLAAVAMPFLLGGEAYAMSIAGPRQRMLSRWDAHVAVLQQVMQDLRQSLQRSEM